MSEFIVKPDDGLGNMLDAIIDRLDGFEPGSIWPVRSDDALGQMLDAIIDLQNKSIVGGAVDDVQINGSSIVNAGVANITQIPLLQTLTQAEYDAIDNPDPNTYYFIVGQ